MYSEMLMKEVDFGTNPELLIFSVGDLNLDVQYTSNPTESGHDNFVDRSVSEKIVSSEKKPGIWFSLLKNEKIKFHASFAEEDYLSNPKLDILLKEKLSIYFEGISFMIHFMVFYLRL